MAPSYHVIIADDDAGVRAVIVRLVARTYPTALITDVGDGQAALHILEQQTADLLITNNDMPYLGGLALIRHLRMRQISIPIVMVSALPTNPQDAFAAGATAFVQKPFTLTELIQTLTKLLPP